MANHAELTVDEYVILPTRTYNKLMECAKSECNADGAAVPKVGVVEMDETAAVSDKDRLFAELVDLIAKPYRNKARTILHFIKSAVDLDEQGRVLFNGRTGATLFDYLR